MMVIGVTAIADQFRIWGRQPMCKGKTDGKSKCPDTSGGIVIFGGLRFLSRLLQEPRLTSSCTWGNFFLCGLMVQHQLSRGC